MNWYLTVLQKYAVFHGRACRSEYWFFILINIIISIILNLIDLSIGTYNPENGFGLLSGIYSLFVLVPTLAVMVRRLHDSNKTGWWLLLLFIPIAGPIVLLIFFVLDSTPGDNEYGPSPKTQINDDIQ